MTDMGQSHRHGYRVVTLTSEDEQTSRLRSKRIILHGLEGCSCCKGTVDCDGEGAQRAWNSSGQGVLHGAFSRLQLEADRQVANARGPEVRLGEVWRFEVPRYGWILWNAVP